MQRTGMREVFAEQQEKLADLVTGGNNDIFNSSAIHANSRQRKNSGGQLATENFEVDVANNTSVIENSEVDVAGEVSDIKDDF